MDFVETFKRNLKAKFFMDAFRESEQLTSSQTNFFFLNVILFYIVLSRWALLCSFVSDAIEIHIVTVIKVVSSEISGGKFPKIYSNLSGNLLITYVNQPFPTTTYQIDAAKQACSWQTTLLDLYALTLCIMFRNNNLFLARLSWISVNSNVNYTRHNIQASANISGNSGRKISGNIIFCDGVCRKREADLSIRLMVVVVTSA